jgi:hypothetical protein
MHQNLNLNLSFLGLFPNNNRISKPNGSAFPVTHDFDYNLAFEYNHRSYHFETWQRHALRRENPSDIELLKISRAVLVKKLFQN